MGKTMSLTSPKFNPVLVRQTQIYIAKFSNERILCWRDISSRIGVFSPSKKVIVMSDKNKAASKSIKAAPLSDASQKKGSVQKSSQQKPKK